MAPPHRHLDFDAGLVSPVAPWTPVTPAGEGHLSMNSHLFDSSFLSDLLAGLVVSGPDPALSGVRDRRRERRPDDAYHNYFKNTTQI